jgi:NAD(P)H-hydrate epimerase
VLTGFIAGLLAQGLTALEAAVVGVYLHGATADYVCEQWGSPYGLRAGDLIQEFPRAVGDLMGSVAE